MIPPQNLSKVALGTMQFLWTATRSQAYKILDTYFDLGGNVIDTADMYTNWVKGLKGGEAETIIGTWMKQRKNRDKIFLSTKVRSKMWEGKDGEGLHKAHITKALEKSLQRLQTDYIDVYFSHWPDPKTPVEETLAAYQELIRQGKIRFIGCSNYSKEELAKSLQAGKKLDIGYMFLQTYYNMLDRRNYEKNLLPLVKRYHLRVMPYGSLAGGFLSGAYRKNKQIPGHARAEFAKEKMTEKNLFLIDVLEELARKYNKTIPQIALAWLFEKEHVISSLVGADSALQVKENFITDTAWLDNADRKKLNRMTSYSN